MGVHPFHDICVLMAPEWRAASFPPLNKAKVGMLRMLY